MFTEPGSARQEAERLVAAVLAAATMAANANPQLSTGSPECCVCPLCKVIAAVRDPDPAMVERLASGAGDLAAGVASFLRHVAAPSSAGDTWRAATRSPSAHTRAHATDRDAAHATDRDARAHNAGAGGAAAHATGWPAEDSGAASRGAAAERPAGKKTIVKKAVVPKAAPAEAPQATDAAERPKKTVVKKAAKKAAPKKAG
jgi:hypothetical protein